MSTVISAFILAKLLKFSWYMMEVILTFCFGGFVFIFFKKKKSQLG